MKGFVRRFETVQIITFSLYIKMFYSLKIELAGVLEYNFKMKCFVQNFETVQIITFNLYNERFHNSKIQLAGILD